MDLVLKPEVEPLSAVFSVGLLAGDRERQFLLHAHVTGGNIYAEEHEVFFPSKDMLGAALTHEKLPLDIADGRTAEPIPVERKQLERLGLVLTKSHKRPY